MKVGIVPASGIGDSVIFFPLGYLLQSMGHEVIIFSNFGESFGYWTQNLSFQNQPSSDSSKETFEEFDCVILQHDNTEKAKAIQGLDKTVYSFLVDYKIEKHGLLKSMDFVCNRNQSIFENLQQASLLWFGQKCLKVDFQIPPTLTFRTNKKQVAIHPSSTLDAKNWPKKNYDKIALYLKSKGFDPVFITENNKPIFSSLEELTNFLYESAFFIGNDSGPGHIASALNIPTLTIGQSFNHLTLWRPSFSFGLILHPPKICQYFRWTQKNWKWFTPTTLAIRKINKLIINSN